MEYMVTALPVFSNKTASSTVLALCILGLEVLTQSGSAMRSAPRDSYIVVIMLTDGDPRF